MKRLLSRIVASKRAELAGLTSPERRARRALLRDTVGALRRAAGAPLRVIAEVKFRSPSAGQLSGVLGAGERAVAYAEAGATMVSVLCDGPFFGGSWDDLSTARAALDTAYAHVPLLAKEFIIDVRQLDWARACGADAVLLIARITDARGLAHLVSAARERALEPLVEVMDERELEAALESRARLIGVNARDLDTLVLDQKRAARVLAAIPRDHVALHLSGIRDEDDVKAVGHSRADAALVGEVLMREGDPRPRLRALVHAAEHGSP